VVPSLLLVEDDEAIGDALRDALVTNGYTVRWCRAAGEAIASFEAEAPDLVLLDVGLPDIDGFTVCRWFRGQQPSMPIVMVTARDSDIDIVVGLDAGASDYVTKPFSRPVLLARIRAHLRAVVTDGTRPIVSGGLTVDPGAHRVVLDGVELDVRPKEFELLLLLVREAGRVVTRDRILREVWDLHWESTTKTLDMHIHALRRKLGDDADRPRWISTIRGVGYRFEGS
jgi:DNA-binding response OmpR family regulator